MQNIKKTHSLKPINSRLRQLGASLIEVMVAVTILSIGLLGLAMLQAKSLSLNTDAYLRSQATLITQELMENMRANPKANYGVDSNPGVVCSPCTTEQQRANADITRWYNAQADLLPPAALPSAITYVAPSHSITMRWQEKGITVSQTWALMLRL